MAASQSVELATLVQCTEKLANGISQDPLYVANKLLEAGLVPPTLVSKMLLPSGENYCKATELVLQVMKVVEGSPQKFDVFMKILKDCYWLNDLVETVCGQYEIVKKDQDEVIQVREDAEEVTNLRRERDGLNKGLPEKEAVEKSLLLLCEITSKLLEVLTSVQRNNVKRRMKIRRIPNRKIQMKEKEIRSLKRSISGYLQGYGPNPNS